MIGAGLPPIDMPTLPPDIRAAAPERRNAYVAALGFEQLLVQQLTQELARSGGDALGGANPYASLLPQAMADGIVGAGGLGLARQLADAFAPQPARHDAQEVQR